MFEIRELIEATGAGVVHAGRRTAVGGISTDSRTIAPGETFVAIKGDNFDGNDFIGAAIKKGAGCIIRERSRGERCGRQGCSAGSGLSGDASPVILEVEDTIRAYGDIARFHRRKFPVPVIAVTGSNGKTTTKEMIAWVLAGAYSVLKNPSTKNNHIGLPAALLDLRQNHDIMVLEIGTNHFGEVEYLSRICEPNIGIITNIGESHLEHLGSRYGVFREKSALIRNLRSPGVAVLNADDIFLRRSVYRNSILPVVIGFGITAGVDFRASGLSHGRGAISFRLNRKTVFSLKTPGMHNVYNALAAVAVGTVFGLRPADMANRLKKFEFPAGRLQERSIGGIRFIDDTYNSNPFSLRQALRALGLIPGRGRKIMVMGDMLELGAQEKKFHREAGRFAAQVCDILITVGSLASFAAEEACACGLRAGDVFKCGSPDEARNILFDTVGVAKNDIVLVKGSRRMKLEQIFELHTEHQTPNTDNLKPTT